MNFFSKKRIASTLIVVFVTCLTSITSAQEALSASEVENFVSAVQEKMNSITSLSGDFQQEKQSALLTKPALSEGEFYYQKPQQLSWRYTKPQAYGVIVNAEKIQVLSQGKVKEMQLGNRELMDEMGQLFAGSLTGELLNNPDFEQQFWHQNDAVLVQLTPKNNRLSEWFSSIELRFSSNQMVKKVTLTDTNDEKTIIRLTKMTVNPNIPETVFNP